MVRWGAWIFALAAAALAVAAGIWMHLVVQLPPARIIMATGSPNLAYYSFGQSYAEALKREGVDIEVQATRGSVDNLNRLHNPDPKKRASVALIQGGIINSTSDTSDLESLGTVFYEPLWLFRRRAAAAGATASSTAASRATAAAAAANQRAQANAFRNTVRTEAKACRRSRHGPGRHIEQQPAPQDGLGSLRGKTIAVGPNGSGIQPLACELLRRHGITWRFATIKPLATPEAVAAVLDGAIDAVFLVASWDAPDVQRLLRDDRVELVSYPQADAYTDFYPYLHKVVLHRGAGDLANDRPRTDVTLIAARASLIIRKDLHPAIQYLLLNAARKIHAKQNVLQAANEFPSAEAGNPPLSGAAQQFYRPGVPYYINNFLKSYFPLWVAEPVNQLLIPVLIVVGMLGVLTPFIRPVPFVFNWVIQRRIFRLFAEMAKLETQLDNPAGKKTCKKTPAEIAAALNDLELRTSRLVLRVPVSYAGMLLIVRQHIELLRDRLR
jgi:TRAP-type uncharacterized transport system substrate-binding protein